MTPSPQPVPAQLYSISGLATIQGALPLPGAVIQDTSGHAVLSGPDGGYILANLPAGQYTLSASYPGVVFDQKEVTLTLPPTQAGINFSGSRVVLFPLIRRDDLPLFADDFSTDSGWQALIPPAAQAGIVAGEYRLYDPQVHHTLISLAPPPADAIPESGYILQVFARAVQGTDLWYGLLFDWVDTGDYCFFSIQPQSQQFAVYRFQSPAYTLLGLGSSASIHLTGINDLELVRSKNTLEISANGVKLGETINLDPAAHRRVGMLLNVYSAAPAEAHFNYFALYGRP